MHCAPYGAAHARSKQKNLTKFSTSRKRDEAKIVRDFHCPVLDYGIIA